MPESYSGSRARKKSQQKRCTCSRSIAHVGAIRTRAVLFGQRWDQTRLLEVDESVALQYKLEFEKKRPGPANLGLSGLASLLAGPFLRSQTKKKNKEACHTYSSFGDMPTVRLSPRILEPEGVWPKKKQVGLLQTEIPLLAEDLNWTRIRRAEQTGQLELNTTVTDSDQTTAMSRCK